MPRTGSRSKGRRGSAEGDDSPIPNQTRCRTLTEEAVDLLRDVLAREADRKEEGRGLEREEIELLADDLKARMDRSSFQAYFKRARDQCLQVVQRSEWAAQRERVLERALVKRFSHLFPDTTADSPEAVTLPRACLPGILQGMRLMVGSEYFEDCQRRARERFHALPAGSSEERWEHAYGDPEINRVVLDVIVHTTPGFQDLTYRFDWLSNLIERNLQGGEGGPPPFGRAQYFALLRSLFAEPGQLMAKGEGQQWLHERYGENLTAALAELLKQLQG